MPRNTTSGDFYEFHRDRPNREIGRQIPRPHAVLRVRRGDDVYTPASSDALSLAKDVFPGSAERDGAHEPHEGDWDFDMDENRRFPHYHPGGDHDNFGHVFYGERGFRVGD